MMRGREKVRRTIGFLLAVLLALTGLKGGTGGLEAKAEEGKSSAQATLTVDLSPEENTGEIIHGASGFLYGISSEDVPSTNTIVPLKSKILVTKGALGTEHPYGDALDVAKTFLESGGEQVQMYNSNYYGVIGPTVTIEEYCDDLKEYICPAIVAWKNAWKEEHGTPEEPKDNIGAKIDIDEAIVYVPINEGGPVGGDFHRAWKSYCEAIKSVDKKARLAGSNDAGYGWGVDFKSFIQFCADNNCVPDVITWHELQTGQLSAMADHVSDFRSIWENTDWNRYNEANGTSGVPDIPQICINEYAEMEYCGVPGRLVNWIARLEDEKITGCLPFWHQANNLNDLAAGANEGNGAWWLYKWYGDMSGVTQPVSSSTNYDGLYGLSTMDEAKKISTTLLGGFTGDITVQLNNITDTETFRNQRKVHVSVQETMFNGFHGSADETPVIVEGAYPVNSDGSVTVEIPDALFESAYNVTVTLAAEDEMTGYVLLHDRSDIYEAEDAALYGNALASSAGTSPSYYMSGSSGSENRAVDMPSDAGMTYTIQIPADGKYRLDFNYGNGQGTARNDMNLHDPVNVKQTIALDEHEAETVIMESTLFQTMTGTKTLYYDLTAGEHTISVNTVDDVDPGMLFHDFLKISYAGVYGEKLPDFNKVYEAELADVNRLLGNEDSPVVTGTDLEGFSGNGYVTGLSERMVPDGGGIRNTVVVDQSGMYNVILRYHSDESGLANIYVGNTAVTLDRLSKTIDITSGEGWKEASATVYLQKGINVVDVDMTAAAELDYMRVRALSEQNYSKVIEAEDAVPAELADAIKIEESEGASGGRYVAGIKGEYENADYLEFTYDAPSEGKYQMQIFHSNEDLAGSHAYNIKVTDKYAVIDVNGRSAYPVFNNTEPLVPEDINTYYFVDCGDHNPETLSEGDSLGINNSVTDQIYGEDSETGYKWGVRMLDPGEKETPGEGAGSNLDYRNDKAVYTNYQKALSNSQDNLEDGQQKESTFRYAHSQDTAGINPRYVAYQFEIEPGLYDVTVGMSDTWGKFWKSGCDAECRRD